MKPVPPLPARLTHRARSSLVRPQAAQRNGEPYISKNGCFLRNIFAAADNVFAYLCTVGVTLLRTTRSPTLPPYICERVHSPCDKPCAHATVYRRKARSGTQQQGAPCAE